MTVGELRKELECVADETECVYCEEGKFMPVIKVEANCYMEDDGYPTISVEGALYMVFS